ncbi:MAG TPA: pectin acetylesterase-family hydrolase [Polyangia bacterium]|nr:pectin acetylesterase-family hydrolase [Polyangia bacterium]
MIGSTRPLRSLFFASVLFAACGGGSSGSDGGSPDGGSPDGNTAALAQWTWIDVPGAACDDGSPTGIAVNPGTSDDLVIYFEGGGACWDFSTCFVLNTSAHGPVGLTQWTALAPQISVGPFDRARATNPLRDASYVFVPYCTGDMHGGNNVQGYTANGVTKTMHHVGRKNFEAALPTITAMWKAPARVVVAGTSAGGYGATFNYDLVRTTYPDAKAVLIDDAGPLLESTAIPATIRTAAYASWKLGDVIDPLCASCSADFSGLTSALATKYPNDRLSLISALTDPTVSLFFQLSLAQFQTDVLAMVADHYTPTSNARAYLVTGTQHGYLATMATTTSKGVSLDEWITDLLDGAASWDTVSP